MLHACMPLAQALRFTGAGKIYDQPPRLAFVGAGGKTTALFQLARELLIDPASRTVSPANQFPAVFVTTTTHLGAAQASLADRHLIVDNLSSFETAPVSGVTLFTGPEVARQRLAGLDAASLDRLLELADRRRVALLIEADGSRLRPLKAPAEHEPALPNFVDAVVVVAGLSALGKPLEAEWVHRPEQFAELAGLEPGEEITYKALARVLSHPQGGLKGIPAGARLVLLLNQADTEELVAAGQRIARMCSLDYDAVILSALQSITPRMGTAMELPGTAMELPGTAIELPCPNVGVSSAHEPAAILLLAAGGSSRFGSPKQLLDWQGQPLVRHTASLALSAGCSRVRVVVGAYQAEVRRALEGVPQRGVPLEIVENPDWQEGQASSVRAGIQGLPAGTGAALFLLVDQPLVPVSLLRGLLDLHAQTLSPLVAPFCQGRRRNPVLFDRVTFPELLALQGDTGGRALFASPQDYPVAWLPWEAERLLMDFDTPEELARLREES